MMSAAVLDSARGYACCIGLRRTPSKSWCRVCVYLLPHIRDIMLDAVEVTPPMALLTASLAVGGGGMVSGGVGNC